MSARNNPAHNGIEDARDVVRHEYLTRDVCKYTVRPTRLLAPPDLSRFTMLMCMSLLHVISVSMPRSHFPASRLEPPNIFCRWGERWARALLHFGTMHAQYLAFRNLVRVQVSCRTCSSNWSATYSRWDPTTRPVSTQASDAMIE